MVGGRAEVGGDAGRDSWGTSAQARQPNATAVAIARTMFQATQWVSWKLSRTTAKSAMPSRIERQLQRYRAKAPHFESVMALVGECLTPDEQSLARLNVSAYRNVCTIIGIAFECRPLSEMGLELGPIEGPGDWALRLAEALLADEYVNLPGGRSLYDPDTFAASGIRLTILKPVRVLVTGPITPQPLPKGPG
jgi:hypothetical protein